MNKFKNILAVVVGVVLLLFLGYFLFTCGQVGK